MGDLMLSNMGTVCQAATEKMVSETGWLQDAVAVARTGTAKQYGSMYVKRVWRPPSRECIANSSKIVACTSNGEMRCR